MAKDFTTREEDYSKWYNDLVVKADLSEHSIRVVVAYLLDVLVRHPAVAAAEGDVRNDVGGDGREVPDQARADGEAGDVEVQIAPRLVAASMATTASGMLGI